MRGWRSTLIALVIVGAPLRAAAQDESSLGGVRLWTVEEGRLDEASADEAERAYPVGSLAKPFVVRAWAESHPGEEAPTLTCGRTSGCWRPAGHGVVDLQTAALVSCNTYFEALAARTPPRAVAEALRAAGFRVPSPPTPREAIGLGSGDALPTIAPRALLRAYVRLTREPWPRGEPLRAALLAGLRRAALEGTAAGVGLRGLWAKTGTVAALDGAPLRTSGWALVVDDAGWAALGLLKRGTGRETAARMASEVRRMRPWLAEHREAPTTRRSALQARSARVDPDVAVRVRVFALMRPGDVRGTNRSPGPLGTSRGFVGPGAELELRAGDHLDAGVWELRLDTPRLVRRIDGRIDVANDDTNRLALVATIKPREYASGVVLAELGSSVAMRTELAAAALRFSREPPRHRDADVCDSTHCAWFAGRGPYVRWRSSRAPIVEDGGPPLSDDEWRQAEALARNPGPKRWTADCGGAPLSPHALWGSEDRRTTAHAHAPSPWQRVWSRADVDRALGPGVRGLSVRWPDGVWTLHVDRDSTDAALRYDDAHARLASVAGWDAMPSPPVRVTETSTGYRVEGVGFGHRVGLCLRAARP